MKITVLLTTVILVLSCKNITKSELNSNNTITEELIFNEENRFKLVINALVLLDDVFEVYFYELGEDTFNSQDFVSINVKGLTLSQDIVFELPRKVYPERLRLDFGKFRGQKEIKLNKISMVYGHKYYDFTKSEIKNEFKPSKFLDFNKQSFIIITKEIAGRYDPYFYTKRLSNIVNYLLED